MREPTKDQHADLFRDLCENANDLIQSVSPEGRFLYVNKAWMKTLGYAPDEIRTMTVFDVIHPECVEHCREAFDELLQGKELTRLETALVTKGGKKVAVEGSVSCHIENGKPLSTRGIFRDMSESRRAQRDLDRMFYLSPDMMCVAGTDGFFKHVNPAFERILGHTGNELLSRSFIEFVHPDDRDATMAAVERLAQGMPVVDFENRYRAKNGSYHWIAWRSAPVAEEGLIYAVATDVTERKRIQALMLQQAEDLARSNADLEMFAYAASHDLRAPLRAIANLSEWVGEDLGSEVPHKVFKHLEKMREKVRRMDSLIDELLEYSRATRKDGTIETVDCAKMIKELEFLIEPPVGFEIATAPGLPVFDAVKSPLELAFRNLIENAIKHHDRQQGRIVIAAADRGAAYEFSVTDDGPGIAPEHREKVFEAFKRLPSERTPAGTGLGLALVRRIVQTFGGHIWIEQAQPRGASLRFTWPKPSGGV